MSDVELLAMTDDELRRALDNAVLCMAIAQTMESRTAWLKRIDEITDEKKRRESGGR